MEAVAEHTHSHICTCNHNQLQINDYNYDPTRTTVLRNTFAREMRKRFRRLRGVIREAIVDKDCFGLIDRPTVMADMNSPARRAFAFPRSRDKVEGFIKWLDEQQQRGILQVREMQQIGEPIEGAWTNRYIQDSYKRGVIRARYELRKAGFDVPDMASTGGIEASMSTPFHMDRVGLLYTRTYNELKGITQALDQQISRVLSQGIADGDNPRLLARKLVATINGSHAGELGIADTLGRYIPAERRAEIMARTEIIRAHHAANIREYENWRVEGLYVKAEWVTTGDQRVCPECASMEGTVYTLEEARDIIPAHPQCRCIALPFKQTHGVRKTIRRSGFRPPPGSTAIRSPEEEGEI
jgi:SPP1 gp7 family putative phage head morphogenesis protein